MNKLFYLTVILLLSNGAHSQILIRGHVFDNFSGLPVGGAKIRVLNSTVSVFSEESNGFFSIIDIPQGAIINNTIELLVTKEGFFPETAIQSITTQNISISLRPEETIVQKWYKRLKESKESNPDIILAIGNIAIDYPSYKIDVLDVLLEIKTGYGFRYSFEEMAVAEECMKLIRINLSCDEARENVKKIKKNSDNDSEEEDIMLTLLRDMLWSVRIDEEMARDISFGIIKELGNNYLVVREVNDKTLGLKIGDVIIKYEGKSISTTKDWQTSLDNFIDKGSVRIEIRRGGMESLILTIPSGEIGVLFGKAEEEELKWLKKN